MDKPNLVVIAGCNGSGKSTFSSIILNQQFSIFDADKRKKELYDAFKFDFELRDQMAWTQTSQEFENLVFSAITTRKDFAFETNFHAEPLYWINQFIDAGYTINLLFFCLENIELAKLRVAIRFENGGHFVANDEVEKRFISGYKNLDKLYQYFDAIFLLEASKSSSVPRLIVDYQKGSGCSINHQLPSYLESYCPDFIKFIYKHI
jgi:predicted ABC-type ATPase